MKYVGYTLLAAPLIALTAAMVAIYGVVLAVSIWAAVAVIMAFVVVGAHLANV